jgi:hypothetical protein
MPKKRIKQSGKKAIKKGVSIPDEPRDPQATLHQFLIMLYGPPKIGKTRFCSQIPNALFISTEPGTKFFRVREMEARTRSDYHMILDALEAKKRADKLDGIEMIIVDTVENLYRMTYQAFLEDADVEHPGDLGHGKGWDKLRTMWYQDIARLVSLGVGIIFVAHDREKDIVINNVNISQIVPDLQRTASNILNPLVDYILFAGYSVKRNKQGKRKAKRVLWLRGDDTTQAGCRGPQEFVEALPKTVDFTFTAFRDAHNAAWKAAME